MAVPAPTATYEIKWGAIGRRRHRNTVWDNARFEAPAQRRVDPSEADYGVARVNELKPGRDGPGDVMRVTSIEAATSPDPAADRGAHLPTYALLPLAGGWLAGGVLREAARPSRSSREAMAIEPVEDGDGIVPRLHEAHRTRGPVALDFAEPPRPVYRCSLLETRDLAALEAGGLA